MCNCSGHIIFYGVLASEDLINHRKELKEDCEINKENKKE